MENKKRIKNIGIIILIIIAVCGTIIGREINDLDEIWNYNISNNIANGLIPYKDYNTIVTPFLQMLVGIVLKVLPNELITMRILAILLISSIILLINKILSLLKIKKELRIILIIGIFILEKSYFCIDYNFFSLFLVLIILYMELKQLLKQKQQNHECIYNLIIGILIGLVCITKQTIGLIIFATAIGYVTVFTLIDKIKYDKEIKNNLKNILYRIIGTSIPIINFILYLMCTKSFNYFIDYAILGIKTFSNKIEYKKLFIDGNLTIKILSILVPVSFIIDFIISAIKKDKCLFVLNCLSIAMFAVAFPISDNIHFLIGSTTSFIPLTYNTNNIIKYFMKKLKNRKVRNIFILIGKLSVSTIFCAFVYNTYINYANITNIEYYSKLEHYKFIPINSDFEEEIITVDKYIQQSDKKVYILNFDAALYMIPINRYNKDYDMFLKGNIGSKGEKGQIEKIKNEDAKYLIIREGINRNWQNPETVRKYIKENMKHTENILNFEVYENY